MNSDGIDRPSPLSDVSTPRVVAAGPLPHALRATRSLPVFAWTREASAEFWRKLSDSRYLSEKAFSRIVGGQLLHALRAILPPRGRVLDFGSGAHGYLAQHLLNYGYQTATYEPGRLASDEYVFANHPNYLGEWSDDPHVSGTFDIVFLCEVIEHLFEEDIPIVLASIRRALKPGGRLIITTPNGEDLVAGSIVNPISGELFHPWQHVRSWTPDSLASVVSGFGFEVQVVHEADFGRAGELKDELARYRAALGSVMDVVEHLCSCMDHAQPVDTAAIRRTIKIAASECERDPALSSTERSYRGDGTNLVAVFRASSLGASLADPQGRTQAAPLAGA